MQNVGIPSRELILYARLNSYLNFEISRPCLTVLCFNSGSPACVFGPLATEKIAWPELLGQGAGDAMRKIKEDMPEAVIEVLTLPCMYTLELRPNRVRLIIDGPGKVVRTPEVG
ncbi:hypothetical protein Vadar_000376 [Vaccinium darrowii]|uniref:Uncharacterized protein n=1 Tax=Vaccinium darrowii TaxID=229202 RepID=A0ACB7XMH5_9ERIC|nr:hypothetical protein Vadar_000376 [Vaccinium darrowii]